MTKLSANNIDFDKSQGLVPVIVQDNRSKEILMLAYVNRLALDETIKTGYGHYWSRSRNKLWKKGEESGNICLLYTSPSPLDATLSGIGD